MCSVLIILDQMTNKIINNTVNTKSWQAMGEVYFSFKSGLFMTNSRLYLLWMCESYNKLIIVWASLVPHVGYWHGSEVEPSGQ